ncbi:MAG: tetratricopeptide repeat protein [Xanthomonadales bacterium]|nr:tetratricopeptide repeat protein [Xanthomonadales bacterium]
MSKDLLDLAGAVADGQTPDWSEMGGDATARNLQKIQRLCAAFGEAREETASGGQVPHFKWCHLDVFELIGSGGFGEVYRAYDPVLSRDVALKLRRASGADALDQTMIQEARRMARVRHPNVLAVHGSDVDGGRAGIWSDLLDGQTLEQFLAGGHTLAVPEFLDLTIPLVSAVAAIHQSGLLHGDLKAGNVMLQRQGPPILMDFGAGAHQESESQEVVAGSPLIMAPETLDGGQLTVAGDIYSLGVLFYRLLAGEYPIQARGIEQLRAAHEKGAEVNYERVPGAMRSLLRQMLHSDPDKRPGAEEVERELVDQQQRPGRRARMAGISAIILALAVGAALAGGGYLRAKAAEEAALRSKAESDYSLQFLLDLLASPRFTRRGADVRVYDLLEDARRELQFSPPQSRYRRAAMASILAETYSSLGDHSVAEELFDQALAVYREEACRCRNDLLLTRIRYGMNANRAADYDKAGSLLQSVYEEVTRSPGAGPKIRMNAMFGLAEHLRTVRREAEAAALLEKALVVAQDVDTPEMMPAQIRLRLSNILMREDLDRAERLARDARDWLERVGQGRSGFSLDANGSLAVVLIEKGEFEQAEQLLQESLAMVEQRKPVNQRELFAILGNLSAVQDRRGMAQQAFETNARALAVAEQAGLTRNANYVNLKINRAVRLQELGRYDEAEAGYREVLRDASERFSPDNTFALLARSNLSDVLLVAGKNAEAEAVAREALENNTRVMGEDHLFSLFVSDVLAASLCRQGDCEAAVEMLRVTHQKKSGSFGEDNPYTHDTAYFLAEALIGTGRAGDAIPLLEGVLENRRGDLGADHKKTREAETLLQRARSD